MAKFTYVGQHTEFITKLFRNSGHIVCFKMDNTIPKLLTQNRNINQRNLINVFFLSIKMS